MSVCVCIHIYIYIHTVNICDIYFCNKLPELWQYMVFPWNSSTHGGVLLSFASLLEAIIVSLADGWATRYDDDNYDNDDDDDVLQTNKNEDLVIQQFESGWLLSHLSENTRLY